VLYEKVNIFLKKIVKGSIFVMTSLRIDGLTKRYGNTNALDEFSLKVDSGQFMVLLGPSGCGKTTAVRCIAGLVNPTSGHIYIGDQMVNQLPPKDRDVAMVFQNYALYPHMTVFNNIAFPLKMRKVPKNQIDDKVRNVANLLDIEDLLDRKPKELSGGQMQRVALGRALVREPKVFLMDEPLSNLDAKLRTYMRTEIKKLQKKVGITTLYITHDQIEAMSMADQVAIMKSGLIQQIGTPGEVYREPANTFVADFVGSPSMNFLKCKIIAKNSEITLESNNIHLQIPQTSWTFEYSSDNIILGIRPRDVVLLLDNDVGFTGIKMKGKITFTEMLGDDSLMEVNIGVDSIRVTNIGPDYDPNIGKEVMIGFPYSKIHYFAAETGKRLMYKIK
jgi:multiple sugar transport system ATP-binding protein